MQENLPLAGIHFPRQVGLIKRLRYISFIITDITIFAALLAILIWITNFPVVKVLLFQKLAIFPFTPVLFILSCIPLLFGAKRHLINTHYDAEKENRPWWYFGIPILFAVTITVIGFVNVDGLTNRGILSIFQTSPYTGFCFFLLGLAIVPPYTQIPHRFHITQFLVFIVICLNVFVILESAYQLFSPLPVQHIVRVPLIEAFCFVFFCFGVLLRWSNRGFFGNFTLDSNASRAALRVFMINLILAPVITLIVLFTMQKTPYNMYQVFTIVIVTFTFTSSLMLWINVKLLYGHELEHLLMRETLRTHNVDLTKEEEALRKRMIQLEQEKHDYLKKLKVQSAWQDVADRLS